MKGTRFYKLIIAALVVINVGTIAFMWLGKPPHPPKPGEGPLLSEKIGLVGEAKTKVDELEKSHHKKKRNLMQSDAELHEQMFSKIGSEGGSMEIQYLISENKKEIERMTFEFFNDVAMLCSKEQLQELKSFIHHAMAEIGHRPPPPKRN